MSSSVQPPPEQFLLDSLERLARGSPTTIPDLFDAVESHAEIAGTSVVHHCHRLRQDGNGFPRVAHLVEAICDYVLEYAMPRSAIADAFRQRDQFGSAARVTHLVREAQGLFADVERSGEGGELLLFVFAETLLRLPQLICKMSFKTNTRSHFQGADGIHAGVDPQTGNLLLYWGESKVYATAESAIDNCIASLGEFLSSRRTGTVRADRDLQLLERYADLDDPALEEGLRRFLDSTGSLASRVEFRGLCLVGFDSDVYGPETANLSAEASLTRVREQLPDWRVRVRDKTIEAQLHSFGMHFICLPFRSVDKFRAVMRDRVRG